MRSNFASRLQALCVLVVIVTVLVACGSTSGTHIDHIVVRKWRYARTRREFQARCFADFQQY